MVRELGVSRKGHQLVLPITLHKIKLYIKQKPIITKTLHKVSKLPIIKTLHKVSKFPTAPSYRGYNK